MDWCSWLSKTGLHSSLIYEYGVAFRRNELNLDDVAHFDHEFLQSMGIAVAKHRLEILKLARNETRAGRKSIFKLVWAFEKTKKAFNKWAFPKGPERVVLSDFARYRSMWTRALRKKNGSEWVGEEKGNIPVKTTMRSGPLDRRAGEGLMMNNSKGLSVSGPLDMKVHEKMMYTNLSPKICKMENMGFVEKSLRESGPLDGLCLSPKMDGRDRVPSLWSLMFQDLKCT